MPDHPAALTGPEPHESGQRSINKGVWLRAFIYVIGFHVFAGFVMLLFYVGSHRR